MQISKERLNTNFNGIKLSKYNYNFTRDIAISLQFLNVNVAGKKTFFVNNCFESKRNTMQYIRDHYRFENMECGFVYLPWSKECWVIGKPCFEQKLLPIILKKDKSAILNTLI